MPDHQEGTAPTLSLAASSLAELLAQARAALLAHGMRHETQRGATRSLNGVTLTWTDPERDTIDGLEWTADEIAWYLRVFVEKRPENDPARPAQDGALVFPYTYAARSRYWDGGWGYLAALLEAITVEGLTLEGMRVSRALFEETLATLGERLHLQTVLSLLALYPPTLLAHWQTHPDLLAETLGHWRRDILADAIADIAAAPASRRAIVSSLTYPHLEDQLQPRMGMPPYQLFQFLPGEADGVINSIHVHRSLDVDGGAPLDFYHDLAWLRETAERTRRPVGQITVVAHNLHMYERPKESGADTLKETIEQWLCRVTDGYQTGHGTPRELLTRADYRANVERVWARWRGGV
ncbi:MAG TPA: thymidylate synthase [Ktedonobacterales bacterium]|jgi:thymidylate synthase-like protein|nr:thymidylate synthase [Ktedonobacterales bacterium]